MPGNRLQSNTHNTHVVTCKDVNEHLLDLLLHIYFALLLFSIQFLDTIFDVRKFQSRLLIYQRIFDKKKLLRNVFEYGRDGLYCTKYTSNLGKRQASMKISTKSLATSSTNMIRGKARNEFFGNLLFLKLNGSEKK